MTLYPPLMLEAVTGDTAITYHAQDFRNIISTLAPNEGVVLAVDLKVSQRGAGANMSVDVAAGRAVISGDSVAAQGTYIARSDATTNVPITAANATNPRIDLIVASIHDKQADGGSTYGWTLTAIAGTPAASPVAPALPASSIPLAQVAVAANAASITTSNVTDKRIRSGVGDRAGWQLSGGDGQSLPSSTETMYAPTTVTLLGVTWTAGTGITIQTPGRYSVFWGARIAAATGSSTHAISVTQNRGGTELRRFTNQSYNAGITEHSTSGTFQLQAGDIVKPLATSANAASSFSDAANQMSFTGFWLAP